MTKHLYDEIAERWYRGGQIYIYSDPHFSDLDCYKLRFPGKFRLKDIANDFKDAFCKDVMPRELLGEPLKDDDIVKELDQMQIDNINKVVHKNDTLIILGDVGNIDCVKKLKAGYKVLIMGNHDAGASNYERVLEVGVYVCPKCGSRHITIDEYMDDDNYLGMAHFEKNFECLDCGHFASYRDGESYYDHKLHYINECIKTLDNHLFDEVYEGSLQIGPKVLLSHEPVGSKYCLNIHGHVHKVNKLGSFTETVVPAIDYTNEDGHVHFAGYSYYSYNCCAEQINYMPVSLKTICESGYLKKVQDIHRATIDKAIDRKNNKKSSR